MMLVSSTVARQGAVLSLFLFTLYTSDFQYNLRVLSVVGCIIDGQATGRQKTECWRYLEEETEWILVLQEI